MSVGVARRTTPRPPIGTMWEASGQSNLSTATRSMQVSRPRHTRPANPERRGRGARLACRAEAGNPWPIGSLRRTEHPRRDLSCRLLHQQSVGALTACEACPGVAAALAIACGRRMGSEGVTRATTTITDATPTHTAARRIPVGAAPVVGQIDNQWPSSRTYATATPEEADGRRQRAAWVETMRSFFFFFFFFCIFLRSFHVYYSQKKINLRLPKAGGAAFLVRMQELRNCPTGHTSRRIRGLVQ